MNPIVLTDSPATSCFPFQNPMSFLKASASKTECSIETHIVSARKYGLPSVSTRLSSSGSPSFIAPQDCCTWNECSIDVNSSSFHDGRE